MSALPELPRPSTVRFDPIFDRGADPIEYLIMSKVKEYGDARAAHARKQALEEARETVHYITLVRTGTALECEAVIGRIK